MKEYVVVLESASGTNGGSHNAITYQFDWSVLDDIPYDVCFSFASDTMTTTAATVNNIVATDLFYGSRYEASTSQVAKTSNALGLIFGVVGATGTSCLTADIYANAPIYLPGRPRQNSFTVNLFQLNGTTLNTLFTTSINYCLILYFKPHKE